MTQTGSEMATPTATESSMIMTESAAATETSTVASTADPLREGFKAAEAEYLAGMFGVSTYVSSQSRLTVRCPALRNSTNKEQGSSIVWACEAANEETSWVLAVDTEFLPSPPTAVGGHVLKELCVTLGPWPAPKTIYMKQGS